MREEGLPLVYPVTCHTDHVGPGSTFVAIKGYDQNGVSFISYAIQKGAVRIIVGMEELLSLELVREATEKGVMIERVKNTRQSLAQLSAQAAGYPAQKLKIIGVTGTKGKTTTVYLTAHLLNEAGHRVALISTVENMIGAHCFPAPLTTPQPDYLHQFLKRCVEERIEWVVMEVAAQAISLHRVEGILFETVIITNIAREHLEFYSSMDAYVAAKLQIRSFVKNGGDVWVNGDDERLAQLAGVRIFGIHSNSAQIRGIHTERPSDIPSTTIVHNDLPHIISSSVLRGKYNLYNMLAAVAGALQGGLSWKEITEGVATFPGVPGRLEQYRLPNDALVIIDYAHNPFSYQAVLAALRTQTDRLVVLFGAGGERDKGRRPEMGFIVAQYADLLILTTDNPRSEDPALIAREIYQGIPEEKQHKVVIELDRDQAVRVAYTLSAPESIIALLGKGQEEYQVVGRKKVPFSEREIIRSFYRARGIKPPI